jgi:small subunit ribosomal protein S20
VRPEISEAARTIEGGLSGPSLTSSFKARTLPFSRPEEDFLAHHASALKHMRQSVKRRARNRSNLSLLKTQVKQLRTALQGGDAAASEKLLSRTVSEIDRAAKKGVIHRNAAGRYKSRLSVKLNALRQAKA